MNESSRSEEGTYQGDSIFGNLDISEGERVDEEIGEGYLGLKYF